MIPVALLALLTQALGLSIRNSSANGSHRMDLQREGQPREAWKRKGQHIIDKLADTIDRVIRDAPRSVDRQSQFDEAFDRLFHGYRPDLRPVPPCISEPCNVQIPVRMSLNFQKLEKLDQVKGTLKIVVWFRLAWPDFRLAYDAATDFGMTHWNSSQDFIAADLDRIWSPDIALINAVSEMKYLSNRHQTHVQIYDRRKLDIDGFNMLLSRPVIVTSRCSVDMQKFPFDEQVCHLTWGAWSETQKFLDLAPMRQMAWDDVVQGTEEFDIVRIQNVDRQTRYPASSDAAYSEVDYVLLLRRRSLWYMLVVIMPLLFILAFSNFVFFIDLKGGKRHSLCATLVLTVMAARLLIAKSLPAANTDMWITRFQTSILLFVLFTAMESIVANYVYFWNDLVEFKGDLLDLAAQLLYPVAVLFFVVTQLWHALNSEGLLYTNTLIDQMVGLSLCHLACWLIALHNLRTFLSSPRHLTAPVTDSERSLLEALGAQPARKEDEDSESEPIFASPPQAGIHTVK